jgi:hypothetical protein
MHIEEYVSVHLFVLTVLLRNYLKGLHSHLVSQEPAVPVFRIEIFTAADFFENLINISEKNGATPQNILVISRVRVVRD